MNTQSTLVIQMHKHEHPNIRNVLMDVKVTQNDLFQFTRLHIKLQCIHSAR